jgi:hypothetical protein
VSAGDLPPPRPTQPAVTTPVRGEARRVPTVAEFAASFEPSGGTHEVELIHPATGQPVKVAFTLPAGSPRRVIVRRRELAFDYGRNDVAIRFLPGGRVRIDQ